MSTSGHRGSSSDASEVVASVDDGGSTSEYVIADITEDGAWIAMRVDDAPELPEWR